MVKRTDTAPNIDIEKPAPELDEQARKGHALAKVLDSAIKTHAAQVHADSEKEEAERKKVEEEKKDAAARMDETLNKTLSCLDALNAKFDAFSSRLDAVEKRDGAEAAMVDKKKGDSEEEGKSKKLPFTKDAEMEEPGDPKELMADKGKKDAFADADALRDEVAQIQSEAERTCSAWGNSADRPMMNETPDQYRRRTARKHQQYSDSWKSVDLKTLSGQALAVAAKQIFADSYAASSAPASYDSLGGLREVRRVNRDTGHVIREFYGQPMAWMQQFTGGRRIAKFNLDANARIKR